MATKQSVFDIQSDFRSFRDFIMDKEGECSDEQYEILKAIKLTGEEKFTQMYFVIQQWEAEAQVAKDAETVAANHRKRRENSIKSLKARMVSLATELGIHKLDNPHCRMTVCPGKESLEILNLDELPADLIDVEVKEILTPKADTILKLLKAKQTVPGAQIHTGDPFLKFFKTKGE